MYSENLVICFDLRYEFIDSNVYDGLKMTMVKISENDKNFYYYGPTNHFISTGNHMDSVTVYRSKETSKNTPVDINDKFLGVLFEGTGFT